MPAHRSWILAAVGGVVAVAAAAAYLFAARPTTTRVDRGPVGERVVARAVVVPSAGVRNVYTEEEGRVLRVVAREGDSVEAGDLLAELERGEKVEGLTAPERGVVVERNCEVGDWALAVARGAPAPLFVLADATRTELRVEVEEADAPLLAPKLAAQIAPVGAGADSFAGRVERVSARLERRTIGIDDARVRADGLVRVAVVGWTGEPPALPLGTRAEVVLHVRRREAAVRVPRVALSVRDGRHVVEQPLVFWTREVPVEVVAVDDAYAEVRGLTPGGEVVVPSEP